MSISHLNSNYLDIAIKEAKKSLKSKDVPVGCVVVYNNKVIARAHNEREKNHSVSSHAEIIALAKASKKLKDWQLVDCSMYVTLEPCLMCASAIIQSKIKNIYIGCRSDKNGSFGTSLNILDIKKDSFKPNVYFLDNKECSLIIKDFFQSMR